MVVIRNDLVLQMLQRNHFYFNKIARENRCVVVNLFEQQLYTDERRIIDCIYMGNLPEPFHKSSALQLPYMWNPEVSDTSGDAMKNYI